MLLSLMQDLWNFLVQLLFKKFNHAFEYISTEIFWNYETPKNLEITNCNYNMCVCYNTSYTTIKLFLAQISTFTIM